MVEVSRGAVDSHLNHGDQINVISSGPVTSSCQSGVGRVVSGVAPLGAHHVIGGVVVNRQHVLLGQHVAVSFNPEVLLHTLKDGAGLHQVAIELTLVARRARGNSVDCGVNNDAHTGKFTNFASANADATATPSDGTAPEAQCQR